MSPNKREVILLIASFLFLGSRIFENIFIKYLTYVYLIERGKMVMKLLEMITIGYQTFLYVPGLLTTAYVCTLFYHLMIRHRNWTYDIGKIFLGITSVTSIQMLKMVVLHLGGLVLVKQSLLFFQTLIAIEFLIQMTRYPFTSNLLKSKLKTLYFIQTLFFLSVTVDFMMTIFQLK